MLCSPWSGCCEADFVSVLCWQEADEKGSKANLLCKSSGPFTHVQALVGHEVAIQSLSPEFWTRWSRYPLWLLKKHNVQWRKAPAVKDAYIHVFLSNWGKITKAPIFILQDWGGSTLQVPTSRICLHWLSGALWITDRSCGPGARQDGREAASVFPRRLGQTQQEAAAPKPKEPWWFLDAKANLHAWEQLKKALWPGSRLSHDTAGL